MAASGTNHRDAIAGGGAAVAANGSVPRVESKKMPEAPVSVPDNGGITRKPEMPEQSVGASQAELDAAVARIPESVRRELDELFRAKFIALRDSPPQADDA